MSRPNRQGAPRPQATNALPGPPRLTARAAVVACALALVSAGCEGLTESPGAPDSLANACERLRTCGKSLAANYSEAADECESLTDESTAGANDGGIDATTGQIIGQCCLDRLEVARNFGVCPPIEGETGGETAATDQ